MEQRKSDRNVLKFPVGLPNAAFGRGMAEVIAEKQAEIDRLKQLIWMIWENVCREVPSVVIDSDDISTTQAAQVIKAFNHLKQKQ